MRLLDKLERRFQPLAVPNLTMVLIVGQAAIYLLSWNQPQIRQATLLDPPLVLSGEVWRLATFLIVPPPAHPVFLVFAWYLFYLMGTALEYQWGTFRYNVFLLVGYVATVAAAFLAMPIANVAGPAVTNAYLFGSVFLAFALLYPDFQILLFFLLPVKVKWLATLEWIVYFLVLAFGDWLARLLVLASISNLLLFFAGEIKSRVRSGRRRMRLQARAIRERNQPRHRCRVCGLTDRDDPKMQFRYCTQCEGQCGYCMDHIHDHDHVTAAAQ